jgi:transcriptional regulator with XRE-family HTH domain
MRAAMPKTNASTAKPGRALREIRKQKQWTLAEVSRRTGLPVSTLSKVENDKLSLSYDKLVRICQGLEVDIARLFGSAAGPAEQVQVTGRRIVTRAGEGKQIFTDTYSHLYPAAELLNKQFNPIIAEPRARSLAEFGELIRHPGEEFAIVLEGSIDFYTELYAPSRLEVGDSVYFDSNMGHAYIRASEGPCKVLSICSATEQALIHSTGGRAAEDEPGDEAPAAKTRVAV